MTQTGPKHPIIGVWRLLAHEAVFEDGGVVSHFGANPRGRLILTECSHMMSFVVDPDRKPGETDQERAALHQSVIAYSGTYRIEGNRFIVAVDLSWHQMWDGHELGRTFQIDGERLHIVSAPGLSPYQPGRKSYGRLSWLREG